VVRALTQREQAEFDRLGVTVMGSPCACDGAEECGCAESELPEREVSTTLDWSLARKFNDFWPSTMEGPHDFPWLGDLVTRERAWRWASQFPQFFATVEAADRDAIRAFIARTLTEVEPPSDLEAAKGKGCCKRRGDAPSPVEPWPPLEDNPRCTQERTWICTECPAGQGQMVDIYPDCHEVKHGLCVPTPHCPGVGPIEPEQVESS
jgi:hypothetical protein